MFYVVIFFMSICSFLDLSKKKYNKVFYIMLLMIIIVDGFRVETGTDWAVYKYFFNSSIKDFEVGYEIYIEIIRKIYKNFQFFILIHSIIVNTLIYTSIYKISDYSFSSLLLTYSLVESILGSNRQLLAMGIIFFSFTYILENKKIGIIGIVLSPLIHSSSIVIYPYFIIKKFLNKKILLKMFLLIPLLIIIKIFLVKLLFVFFNNSFFRADLIIRIKEYINYSQNYSNLKLIINLLKLSSLIIIMKILFRKNIDKNKENFFWVGAIYSIIITTIFWGIFQIVAGRGNYYTIILFIFSGVGYGLKNNTNTKQKILFIIIVILYSIMTFERGIKAYRDLFIPYKGLFYNKEYNRKLY